MRTNNYLAQFTVRNGSRKTVWGFHKRFRSKCGFLLLYFITQHTLLETVDILDYEMYNTKYP